MRIDINPAASASITHDAHTAKVAPKRPDASANLAGVTASLSADSARLSALHSQLASMPDVRQEQVASLRSAVLRGSYQADSSTTAASMFSEYFGRGERSK